MKKLIKKLFAPIAIFAMALGVTISVNSQNEIVRANADTYTDSISAKGWAGSTLTAFSGVGVDLTAVAPTSGATIAMQIINPSTGAVRGNQSGTGNFSMRNTTEYPGYIRKITLIVTGGTVTTSSTRSVLSLGTSPFASDYVTTTGSIGADIIGASQSTVTWTIPAGQNYKYFKLHSLQTSGTALAAAANAIQIQYETISQTFGTLDRIEVSGGKTSYVVGETFTTAGLTVTAYDTTNFSKTVTTYTTNKTGYTFLSTDIGTVTIIVSYTEGTTETTTFDVSVSQLIEFSKITSESELYFGAEYVIVSEGATNPTIMTTTYTTFFGRADVTINSEKLVKIDTHQIIKLVISPITGTYGLQLVNGAETGKYLAITSDNNNLNTVSSLDNTASWFMSFESGNVIINSASIPTRNIKYNNSSPRFSTYTSAQTSIQLYLNSATVDDTVSATMVATEINSGKGSAAQGTCSATLEFLNNAYGRLSATARNTFDTSSNIEFVNARARLSYLGSWVASHPSARPTITLNDSNNLSAVITIGAIGLTSILAYYFLNKKKAFK